MRPRSRRRGAGAHVLFARSVVLGLSSPVKDHSAVAGSTSTFNEKKFGPSDARLHMHAYKPTYE